MRDAKTDLSYWFPILQGTGAMVPKTIILKCPVDLGPMAMGERVDEFPAFAEEVKAAADAMGYPCFLRTGMTSGKHEWKNTCFIDSPEKVSQHIYNLVEFSECADIFGIPHETWVVREFLNLETSFTAFRGFPVNQERRYFIAGGKVICSHPYWPEFSIEGHKPSRPDWKKLLEQINHQSAEEIAELTGMSEKISLAFDGAWSLDWARTVDGKWYAIDMAEAHRSFHWPGCPNEELFKPTKAAKPDARRS
jgi:ATP-grasp domain, R2K clade family 3